MNEHEANEAQFEVDPAVMARYGELVDELEAKVYELHAHMQLMAQTDRSSMVTAWCLPVAITAFGDQGTPVSNVYMVSRDSQPIYQDLGLLETVAASIRNNL